MLLNPAEDASRELLEARYGDGGVKGLEQGLHDALENVELHLVRDLVLPLVGVVLMRFHNLLVVPETEHAPVVSSRPRPALLGCGAEPGPALATEGAEGPANK